MICNPRRVGELFRRAQAVRAILFDIDGVFTDGYIIYDSEGREIKHFNCLDGQAIKMARLGGLKTGIISARESEAIRIRARELHIDGLRLGRHDKLAACRELQKELNLREEEICFVGDDLPDIPVLERVGLPVAVANAAVAVKARCPFYTRREGGRGAIREVVEFVLHARGELESVVEQVISP